jgi:hypothetical protein
VAKGSISVKQGGKTVIHENVNLSGSGSAPYELMTVLWKGRTVSMRQKGRTALTGSVPKPVGGAFLGLGCTDGSGYQLVELTIEGVLSRAWLDALRK